MAKSSRKYFARHIRRPSPLRVGSRELLKLTLWNYVEMQGASTPSCSASVITIVCLPFWWKPYDRPMLWHGHTTPTRRPFDQMVSCQLNLQNSDQQLGAAPATDILEPVVSKAIGTRSQDAHKTGTNLVRCQAKPVQRLYINTTHIVTNENTIRTPPCSRTKARRNARKRLNKE
jgi:hypothetical protein